MTGELSLQRTVKRTIDVIGASCALILLAPVMLVVGALVWLRLGGPVIFAQERPGLHGRTFRMYKFRTMLDRAAADGRPAPDAERLTPFGRRLRATSLDELPELWNVLRGDMSFVGPRPLLVEYLPLYDARQFRRHEVRPGITGWAQVNGRNALAWEQRFELDVWYVEHWSLWLDAKILVLTVLRVLRADGISQPGEATMQRFQGSRPPGEREVGQQ